jgi:hypothetical protein
MKSKPLHFNLTVISSFAFLAIRISTCHPPTITVTITISHIIKRRSRRWPHPDFHQTRLPAASTHERHQAAEVLRGSPPAQAAGARPSRAHDATRWPHAQQGSTAAGAVRVPGRRAPLPRPPRRSSSSALASCLATTAFLPHGRSCRWRLLQIKKPEQETRVRERRARLTGEKGTKSVGGEWDAVAVVVAVVAVPRCRAVVVASCRQPVPFGRVKGSILKKG